MHPDYATHLTEIARLVSRGHGGGRYRMRLFANGAALRAWHARARRMPVGALFAAAHSERGRPGPLLVMQKRAPGYDAAHGDWYYAVADSAARRVLRQGRLADCAGCHSTAPTDHVFMRVEPALPAK